MQKPEVVQLEAQLRDTGSKNAKDLRNEKVVPAVVYGPGVEGENLHIQVDEIDVDKILSVSDIQFIEINVDGKKYLTLFKKVEFHPVNDRVLHLDLYAVEEDVKVITRIPIRLEGTAIGVQNGGRIFQPLHKIKVKALPSLIPAHFSCDITKLKIGANLHISDLNLEGIEPLIGLDRTVVIIKPPRSGIVGLTPEEDEDEDADEESAEGAEGEGAEDAEGEEA
jgi:large subunit ribosomal protein L25